MLYIYLNKQKAITTLHHKKSGQDITIVLAEDHTLVRQGFVALLAEEPGFRVTGQAANGRELLDLLKHTQPDIILLDIEMPVMNGRQALEVIVKKYPGIKVIMLSMHVSPGMITEFMALGASAFLPKEVPAEILLEALETVKREGHYYNNRMSGATQQNFQKEELRQPAFQEQELTGRELTILKLLCDGKTNSDIAKELNISYNTVDFHRGNLYTKTRTKNVADLVKYAIKHRILKVN